jgi:hypothetical protein
MNTMNMTSKMVTKDGVKTFEKIKVYEQRKGLTPLNLVICDGGREDAGYKGNVGDCVTRAITIATAWEANGQYEYEKHRSELMKRKAAWRKTSRSRRAKASKSNSVRNGTPKDVYRPYLEDLGWKRVSLVKFGDPTRKEMVKEDIPNDIVILEVRKHIVACINHTVIDTWDCRESTLFVDGYATHETKPRTVNGYWIKEA